MCSRTGVEMISIRYRNAMMMMMMMMMVNGGYSDVEVVVLVLV